MFQSFGLPPLVPKPTVNDQFNIHDDNYGIPNPMVSGYD